MYEGVDRRYGWYGLSQKQNVNNGIPDDRIDRSNEGDDLLRAETKIEKRVTI